MTEHHVRVARGENGSHVVAIDGHEIQNATEAVHLSMSGRATTMRLHLQLVRPDISTRARVLLDEASAAALVAMGWTPPAGGE